MEEAFGGLSGIDEIRSTSLDGFATIIVQFVFGKDPDQATQDVRDAISGIRDDLPAEMKEPVLRKFDPNDLPIVSLVLASDTLAAARADPARRPRHHPRAARHQRRRPGDRGGRRRPRDLGRRAAGGHGGGGRHRRPGGARRCRRRTWRRRSARSRGARASRRSACSGRLESPEDFAQLVVGAAQRPARPPRPGGRRARRHRRAAHPRRCSTASAAVGIDITKSQGCEHHQGLRTRSRRRRRSSSRPCRRG